MNWFECGVIFFVAVITTVVLTPFAKFVATKFDAIDYPDKDASTPSQFPAWEALRFSAVSWSASASSSLG